MCGIAGLQGRIVDTAADLLRHRGPDAFGVYEGRDVKLLHWRLSILDLSERGNQPMASEDGSVRVVFNGEIYNFRELRRSLEKKGHVFRSDGDSEVLVHLYEEKGAAMLPDLRGMFAFGIWDEKKEELFLARDALGVKPLVYAEMPGGFAFASELRFLASLPSFVREIDERALRCYLRLNYIPAPLTIWKGARKLLPGRCLVVRSGRVVKEAEHWQPACGEWRGGWREAAERLDAVLRESVALHLVSDVPVGAFLSGGLDSSLVAALAQKSLGGPIRTFTVSFPEVPQYDESRHARIAADHIGTDHTEISVEAGNALDVLEEIVEHLDEPFADSSLVPTAVVSRVTRRSVKVALSGDGGDELFGGYSKYQGLRLAAWLGPLGPLLRAASSLPLPESRGSRAGERVRQFRKLARMSSPSLRERILASMEVFSRRDADALMPDDNGEEFHAAMVGDLLEEAEARNCRGLNRILYLDSRFVLPFDMFWKVDTASMRYSLEVRVPLVDQEVASLALSLPPEWKLRGLTRKWLLRKVAERYLPPEIVKREKGGFGIPLGEWMRGGLAEMLRDTLSVGRLRDAGIGNPGLVENLIREHGERKRDRFWELWNLFILLSWRRRNGV